MSFANLICIFKDFVELVSINSYSVSPLFELPTDSLQYLSTVLFVPPGIKHQIRGEGGTYALCPELQSRSRWRLNRPCGHKIWKYYDSCKRDKAIGS